MKPKPQPNINHLRIGFRRKLLREFLAGSSVAALCRRHCLTRAMVEEVVRVHGADDEERGRGWH